MRRLAKTAIVLGLALVVLPPVLWQRDRAVTTVGDVARIEASVATTVTSQVATEQPPVSPANPVPAEVDNDATEHPGVGLEVTNGLAPLSHRTGPQPVGLRIEAIAVAAPIDAYGVDERTGQMDVPDNVSEVAWYQYGASPGERGSAVLAAHVDLASQGPGVFFDLRDLVPGDRIHVEYDDGSERMFAVSARTVYEKTELPLDVIFAKDGPPRLTLVTCGGGFNATAQSYDSNVVVYATPLAMDAARFGAV